MGIVDNNTTANILRYKVIYSPVASRQLERDVYRAIPVGRRTSSIDDVVAAMVKNGTMMNASTIRSVITSFADTVVDILNSGQNVSIDGFAKFSVVLRGNLDSADANYDIDRSNVEVNIAPGKRLKTAAQSIVLRKQEPEVQFPKLEQVIDGANHKSGTITSESMFLLTGKNIAWNPSQEDEGVFILVGGEEGRCTSVEATIDPQCAVVLNPLLFETDGLPVQVFLRTRLGGESLHQIEFDGEVFTRTKA